jgi:transposase, IS5 family
MIGARSFPGNPYDGHILSAQLEQSTNLLQDLGVGPKEVVVDLGFRGEVVQASCPGIEIIHRGKYKMLTQEQKRWLKRRQAVEPAIGHLKCDHGMDKCWFAGELGDVLHALSCAVGYNVRCLLRAIARLGLKVIFLRLKLLMQWVQIELGRLWIRRLRGLVGSLDRAVRGDTPKFLATFA